MPMATWLIPPREGLTQVGSCHECLQLAHRDLTQYCCC